jgi:hypothetical protein
VVNGGASNTQNSSGTWNIDICEILVDARLYKRPNFGFPFFFVVKFGS